MKGQKESYDELKQKYDALVNKHQGRAYIAEGKSWNDSDNDDDEAFWESCKTLQSQPLHLQRYHFFPQLKCPILIISKLLKI